jgi:hypothetical protein
LDMLPARQLTPEPPGPSRSNRAPLWEPFIHGLSSRFRRARARRILRLFPDIANGRVCDLGGSLHFWETVAGIIDCGDLTILNISQDGQSKSRGGDDRCRITLYDGQHIPFPDRHFDTLLCNSVIEHVPPAHRSSLCAEMRRVSKRIVLQTPAFGFPIEPHFVLPCLHWLPRSIGRKLAFISPWRVLSQPPPGHLKIYFDEITLLRRSDLQALFPELRIVTERFIGLPKSYLIVGP